MPVNIPDNLPAIEILKEENIFVMNDLKAQEQDIRPLKILILNLMPIKIDTETDFIRLLSNTPLQLEISFLQMESHASKNTTKEHLDLFYKNYDEIKDNFFDGMIVTGAPVEMLDFEEVNYWQEITEIFDWARIHVTSTIYICWGAQAALYHFYKINKTILPKKLFGVFKHKLNDDKFPLFRGFDDSFNIPHSRHTTISKENILEKKISILAESVEAGVGILMSRDGREFYFTGHSEYSPYTLHNEYVRDLEKGLDILKPKNYYENDDETLSPAISWRGHANLLFNNWLNYFVYQRTPYNINDIKFLENLSTSRDE